MKTLIHIGMGKTGTTALQKSLAFSRDYLEQNEVLYPTSMKPLITSNHQILVQPLLTYDRFPRDLTSSFDNEQAIKEAYDEFLLSMAKKIRKIRPACVVVSAESLFRQIPEAKLEALKTPFDVDGAAAGSEIEIVAYVRKPSERFASSLQQALKYSHVVRKPQPPRYRDTLESYESVFRYKHVHVRTFRKDTLIDNDVVADFVAAFLGDYAIDRMKLAAPPISNETLSAESTDICRRYRRAFHADRENHITADSRRLLEALHAIDAALGARRPVLRPAVAEAIDYSSADPRWLRDRYGVEFPEFDYARVATARTLGDPPGDAHDLGALFEIDPDVEAEILERLRAAPWAADPGAASGGDTGAETGDDDSGAESEDDADSGARLSWIDAVLTALDAGRRRGDRPRARPSGA